MRFRIIGSVVLQSGAAVLISCHLRLAVLPFLTALILTISLRFKNQTSRLAVYFRHFRCIFCFVGRFDAGIGRLIDAGRFLRYIVFPPSAGQPFVLHLITSPVWIP